MNYHQHYQNLIEKYGMKSKPEGYYEKHHIVPTCLGGGNNSENLIWLTAEAHYVAHQLLVKINPYHFGLTHAAVMMTIDKHGNRVNNKRYSWLKKKSSELRSILFKGKAPSALARKRLLEKLKGKPLSVEHVEKIRTAKLGEKNPRYGKKLNEEELIRHSEIMKKVRNTEEQKLIQKELATERWKREDYRNLMKEAHVGRKNTQDTKLKMSESNKKVWEARTEEEREAFKKALKEGWEKRRRRLSQSKEISK